MLDVQAGDVVAYCSKCHVTVPEELDGVEMLEAIRAAFNGWLRERALRDLRRLGRRYEAHLEVQAKGYHLSAAKGRCGSLGRDGVIRVHWRPWSTWLLTRSPT